MSNGARKESHARLGVFVVCGLILAVAAILALGWGRLFERTEPVFFYFDETVQGLEPGGSISYRGVRIGRVGAIRMAQVGARRSGRGSGHEAIIEVEGELFPAALNAFGGPPERGSDTRDVIRREVREGLRVRVAWKDITGQKYLDVDYLDPEAYPPKDIALQPREPYIPTAASPSLQDIQRDLATTLGSLAKINYEQIGARTEALLELTTRKIDELKLEEVTGALRDAGVALRDLAGSEELRRGLTRFDELGAEVQRLVARANDLLAKPEFDRGIEDLAVAMRSLSVTAKELEGTLPAAVERVGAVAGEAQRAIAESKLPETTESIRAGAGEIQGAARNVSALREDLRLAFRELAEASRNIGRLADFLERHPESLLRGRGGEGGK
jgi:ABC-type transporter Mla subunit MlaD